MPNLGDVVHLSFTVRGPDGAPANAGAVTVTVQAPDGTTTTTGPITPTAPGEYAHDFAAVHPGRHGVRWVATAPNAAAHTDAFLVDPDDPGAFVSLAEVKAHMDKTGAQDDAELAGHRAAACQMIRDRIGHVSPVTRTETRRAREVIVLAARPVIEVTSVTALPEGEPIPPADPSAGVDGWTLDGPAGVLTHRHPPRGRWRVTYRAGRTPVPANVRLAALELTAHLWRSSQLNSGGGRPPLAEDDTPLMPGSAYALPLRVRELLGLGRHPSDEIHVG